MKSFRLQIPFICIIVGTLIACSSETPEPIQQVLVNETLFLNTIESAPLRNPGQGIVLKNAGIEGIYVYRDLSNILKAFDMVCPHDPNGPCGRVTPFLNGQQLRDSCCTSVFSPESGFPVGGPARSPLLEYQVSESNGTVRITNQ